MGIRTAKLIEKLTSLITEEDKREYEELDQIRIEGMKHAEKGCRQLKMGAILWTPNLLVLKRQLEVFLLVHKG